ncbi:MFS transporter [Paraburkholderia sp. CNPSo 3274]|uniref:MFS transporter n=1 Tax=Paraburkholderia sp. CNPSo 3274 TaxID=2940932 RepID=UPI0020B749A9|nr:MFS transporter [Paraburkholderia sp. CNPSo 3274]MCP3705646.1 MFS transporter [Paraburkholderia sp. CNPSo 3274]
MTHAACPAVPANQRGSTRRYKHVARGRRASFWVSAGVVAHTLWTSAAPAMTYRLYASEWHLTQTTTAEIFAVYPIVVVSVLILFGGLSDQIGWRATMLLGLGASFLGALTLALAHDVSWLFVARAFMGVGIGLTAGPSTAAMVEFNEGGAPRRASVVATAAQAAGFAAALIVGGALTQYAPWPLHLAFWLLALLIAALFTVTWFLPLQAEQDAAGGWTPSLPSVPQSARKAFMVAAFAMITAYTHGVMILSLGGQIAHDLVRSPNTLVNGSILAVFAITSGVVSLLGKSLSARTAMIVGAAASAAGMGLLAVATAFHGMALFLSATAMTGAGYSLLFLSALDVINGATPVERRGGTLSALYLLGYLAVGILAPILGRVATVHGLGVAVYLGAGVIAALSFATLGLAVGLRRTAER